jgi:hypothetical protein
MRWFMILAVAALTLADPAPVRAQGILGGYPSLLAPNSVPFAPLSGGLVPGGSGLIPFASGSPVEFGLNRAFWNMAASGYGGPLANYFSPLGAPRSFLTPFAVNPNGLGVVRPLMVPATPGRLVVPYGNPGLHKGWYKGKGKGKGR